MIKYILTVVLVLICADVWSAPLTPGLIPRAKTGSILMDGTIYDNGNVGIGSTSPRSKLDVDGAVYGDVFYGSGAGLTDLPAAGTTDHAALSHLDYASSGHTGFQPAGSYLTAEVDGSITNEIQDLSLTGNTLALSGDASTVDLSGYLDNTDDQTCAEVSGCVEGALTAETDPKVGTLTPGYHAKMGSTTLVDSLIYDNGTNVGIGSATPSQKLDVGGNIVASGTITGSNLSGTNTGDQTTITGNAGTATALASNGTNCPTGYYPKGVDASGNAEGCVLIDSTVYQPAGSYLTSVSVSSGLTGNGTSGSPLTVDSSIYAKLISPVFTTPNIGSATGSISGNAGTATALASDPTDCGTNAVATAIAANGNLTCGITPLVSGGTLTSGRVCRYDGTGIDCDRLEDGSGDCAANSVCMGGHTHTTYLPLAGGNVTGNLGIGTTSPRGALDVKTGKIYTPLTGSRCVETAADGSLTVAAGTCGSGGGLSGLTSGNIPKASSASTIVDSAIYENGGNVGIGTTTVTDTLLVQTTTGGQTINFKPEGYGGYDTYSKLLVHFNGSNGATSHTAESGQTASFYGTASLSTAQKVFGTASLALDGNSDYVTFPDSDDWSFGTGVFTVDLWVRYNDLTGYQVMTSQEQTTSNWWFIRKMDAANGHKIETYFRIGGAVKGYYTMTSAWTPSTGQWYHIAFQRTGTTATLYIDGVSKALTATTEFSTNDVGNISSVLYVGATGDGGYTNGWVDEVRISKGIVRWATNFTPPAREYDGLDQSLPSLKLQGNGSQTAKLWTDGNNSNAIKIDDATGTRLTIASGNVGIGTISPSSSLDVTGTFHVSGTSTFDGNVGIGTSSPTTKLHVYSTNTSPNFLWAPITGEYSRAIGATEVVAGNKGYIFNSGSNTSTSGHGIGVFGYASDTTLGAITLYATEGRVDAHGQATYHGLTGRGQWSDGLAGNTSVFNGTVIGVSSQSSILNYDKATARQEGINFGFFADSNTGGLFNYGMLINNQTSGFLNFGLGVRTATNYTVHISPEADNTTANAGITFGQSGDTQVFRAGAGLLGVTGAVQATGGFKSSDGTDGGTGTINVRNAAGTGSCTITVKNGLMTATTCP